MSEHQLRKAIEDFENEVKQKMIGMIDDFTSLFGRHPFHKRTRRLVMLSIQSSGPMKLTFNKNHKGEFTMNIALGKGGTATATFGGTGVDGAVEPITGLAVAFSDAVNGVSPTATAVVTPTSDGNGFTAVITALADIKAPGISVVTSADDADGDALPSLTDSLVVSDDATTLVNTTGWVIAPPPAPATA
jgi:hypothetical protein